MTLLEAIGYELRLERERRSLTQQEAASRYGCTPQNWQRIEGGSRDVHISVLVAAADVVGLVAHELLRRAQQRIR